MFPHRVRLRTLRQDPGDTLHDRHPMPPVEDEDHERRRG
jgi:hypothetical protein